MALSHTRPGEVVALRPLGPQFGAAKTTAIVKTDTFEAVRLVVRASAQIAPHQVPGPITLHCLEGRVRLDLSDSTLELGAGDWIYLEGGAQHSLSGIEDASLLLTILFNR